VVNRHAPGKILVAAALDFDMKASQAAIQKRDQEQDVGMSGCRVALRLSDAGGTSSWSGRQYCWFQSTWAARSGANSRRKASGWFPASSFQAASNWSMAQHASPAGRGLCAPSVNLEPAGKVCYACGLTSSHTRLDAGVGYIHSP
jgi:hypothetical protein